MDIIAAHQQGLIEQLEEDVKALAGRPRDHGQRAVVLHHLFDHSRGVHAWALAEARRELRIARALAALGQRLDRWGWMISGREQARSSLAMLAADLGEASRARCAAAYGAYRLSATPALRGEAEARLPAELLAALEQSHVARRTGLAAEAESALLLGELSEAYAASAVDQQALASAWQAIDATRLARTARRLVGDKALDRAAARDRKRGLSNVEARLRADPMLPASFRANPAQHFYALQYALAERRRQLWREACDREPDSFELAA
jgi:hypothetical protein